MLQQQQQELFKVREISYSETFKQLDLSVYQKDFIKSKYFPLEGNAR